MSELPQIGRRGFRDWDELHEDLEAIVAAEPPANVVSVWRRTPMGGRAPSGRLTLERTPEATTLVLDGEPDLTLRADEFRGAWQWRPERGGYYLNLDLGQRDNVQIGGCVPPEPGSTPTA